jgi:ubiquinone/menaquinone biosynthesis C-methylase UbiE
MTDQYEAESNGLVIQHRYLTAALGGLLPKNILPFEVHTVLDVGCGPGGWALDLVKQYPHMTVTAIDISEAAIADAKRRAQANGIGSASFLQMDATKPLPFKNATFDLVHMRSASSFIRPVMWPTIIDRLVRALRPGGWINLVDYEQGPSSSDAFNTIAVLMMQAIRMSQSSLAPASPTLGAAARLYGFLLNAYLLDVSYSVHAVDFGWANNPAARDFIEEMLVAAANIKPFLSRLGLIESDASYEALISRAREELRQPDTAGYGFLISAVGHKDE